MSASESAMARYSSFTIERRIDGTPREAFATWSSMEAKSRSSAGTAGAWKVDLREFDFRVGGDERLMGTRRSGTVTDFRAHYRDIVPDRRPVHGYAMRLDDKLISVLLATIEIEPCPA